MVNDSASLQSWQNEAIEKQFVRTSSYNNLIIVLGYGGYFALWDRTREFVSPLLAKWSATCMMISLMVFVFWEISKMIYLAQHNKALSSIQLAPPEEVEDLIRKYQYNQLRLQSRFNKGWIGVLLVTVLFGVFAAGVHIVALFISIWKA